MPDSAEAHTLRSYVLLGLDRARSALKAGREAVRLAPHDEVAHAALARAAVAWGNWKEAETSAAEVMRLAPQWTEGYLVMGALELKLGHKTEAESIFREAVRIDPSEAMAINDLAMCLAKQGRNEEARALLETGARTDPSAELVQHNLYRETFRHVSGRGPADRLDLLLVPPFFILIAIDAAIVLGWVRPHALVSGGAFGLTLFLGAGYAILDGIRGRQRFKAQSRAVQLNYRRRFYRDWRSTFGFVLYFSVTCVLPAIVLSIVVQTLGAPEWLQWAVSAAVLVVWVPVGGFAWLAYVHPWVVRKV